MASIFHALSLIFFTIKANLDSTIFAGRSPRAAMTHSVIAASDVICENYYVIVLIVCFINDLVLLKLKLALT